MQTKLQELILPFLLAIITVLAFQYYWGTREVAPDTTGRRIDVPQITQKFEAPDYEIDFYDDQEPIPLQETSIETDEAQYLFSNHGASLQRLAFKRMHDGAQYYLEVLEPLPAQEREARAFLVALDRQTPYYFTLVQQDEDETAHFLTYEADFGEGVLRKKFIIYKETFKIDVSVTVTPKAETEPLRLRIFYNSPHIAALKDDDKLAAFVDEAGNVTTYKNMGSAHGPYWERPSILGLQDRYYVNAYVADPHAFVQRGYFKKTVFSDGTRLQAIIQSQWIKEPSSWTVSFYVGPKTSDAMMAVDPRLDKTIEYGFFATISRPISKVMLKILNTLNDYTHNYGLAIIVLTLLMRLIMIPFTFKSETARKQQEEFQKRLKYIQQRYKDDPEALAQARMELVRKHGVMPGAGGCLPLFLQLPLFWGLSVVLSNAIELYNAPFLWVSDLSSRDPYYILPALAGLGIVFAMPGGADPKQRIVGLLMGLFLFAIFANFSAGLTLYIAVSMLFAAAQMHVARWMKQ